MYKRSSQSWTKHLDFMMLDLVCLQVSFFLAYIIRHGLGSPYAEPEYRSMAVVMTLFVILIMIFFETFKNVLKRGYYSEFTATLKQMCLLELGLAFYLFMIQGGASYSRAVMYLTGAIYVVLGYTTRILWKNHLKRKMKEMGRCSLLILTTAERAQSVILNIENHNYKDFRLTGVALLDMDKRGEQIAGVPVVADRETVVSYACREWVDEVFIDLPEAMETPQALVEQFTQMGAVVHIRLLQAGGLSGRKQLVERLGNYTVLTTSINYASDRQMLLKRLLDILGGLAGSLATIILSLILAPIILIQSPGPLFFVQERVGKNGKRFKMYKFRSMYVDAEERKKELLSQNRIKDGYMFKLDWDPRIIGSKKLADGTTKKGVGNFIRDWSLDEFPQFFNVLKGDMSLVGTRPPTVEEWERYELHHRARLSAKPGITGLWQVSGRSNITDFEEVVKLDVEYISRWSMGMDIRILVQTVKAVLRKNGAM